LVVGRGGCGVHSRWKGVVELGRHIDGNGTALDPHGWLGAVQRVLVQDVSLDSVLARLRVGAEVVALDALPVRLAGVNVLEGAHQGVDLLLCKSAWLLLHLFPQWFGR